jgi:hypothetical protein
LGEVIIAEGPLTCDQVVVPVPANNPPLFPLRVNTSFAQIVWSTLAFKVQFWAFASSEPKSIRSIGKLNVKSFSIEALRAAEQFNFVGRPCFITTLLGY